MSKNLSQEAIELLQYLMKNKEASDFCDYFNASTICHRKGHLKVGEIKPLLEELSKVKAILPSKQLLRSPKYLLNTEKSDQILEEIEEENTIYTEEYREALIDEIKSYKKFVITTAVIGKEVNQEFADSLRNYAKRNNALLIALPCEDVVSRGKKAQKTLEISPDLSDFRVVFKDTYINKNLCLCAIKVSAKQINPLTGLDRLTVKRQASIIVASPKVFLRYIPNMHYDIPPALMTTGAVTVNNYDTDKYMSKRTSALAEEDHAYGAVIVEVENDKIFHFRHVRASSYNSVTDLGIDYLSDGSVQPMNSSVMIMGDSHTGYHDKELHLSTMEAALKTGVDTVFLHDVFNGTSITHHDVGKGITRAIKARENKLGLADECVAVRNYINNIQLHGMEVFVVKSNHDNHLLRYLEDGRYIHDPKNYELSVILAAAAVRGHDPLQYAIEEELNYKDEHVHWLEEDKSCQVYGVECSMHGDRGSNGSKGSLQVFEKGLGNCVTAHTHSAAIIRDAFCVGTVGVMNQGYNRGLSSWTRTCCLIYKNGTKQLINFIPDEEGSYSYSL
jgi:hypothetical protein